MIAIDNATMEHQSLISGVRELSTLASELREGLLAVAWWDGFRTGVVLFAIVALVLSAFARRSS